MNNYKRFDFLLLVLDLLIDHLHETEMKTVGCSWFCDFCCVRVNLGVSWLGLEISEFFFPPF